MIKFYINANAHSFPLEIEQIYTLKVSKKCHEITQPQIIVEDEDVLRFNIIFHG